MLALFPSSLLARMLTRLGGAEECPKRITEEIPFTQFIPYLPISILTLSLSR